MKPLAAALLTALLIATSSAAKAAQWRCPSGYRVHEGLNTDFPVDGVNRAFVVVSPKIGRRLWPVWVPMSGSVESEDDNLNVERSGANAKLADDGFMVISPIRECAGQDPKLAAGVCNGPGHDGWSWNPWHEGRAPDASGDRYKTDEGSDSRFLVAMVRCVGTKFPLDRRRLYVGGISSGGTMTNRSLLFRSDFWAGGMPISGEWYVTADDGSFLPFAAAGAAVRAAPYKIHQGRVAPFPLPAKLAPMIVITVWGGAKDIWYCGTVLCSDYRPTTQAASVYFSSMPNVVHVACSADDGHRWPKVNTDAFNRWALETLSSYPKGSTPDRFKLTPPPEGYGCRLGAFTDHYPAAGQ